MSYMHILNLHSDPTILLMRRAYAMEKCHGTSSHITLRPDPSVEVVDMASGVSSRPFELGYFAGGAKYEAFKALFDAPDIIARHAACGYPALTIYGEAYGGAMQRMSHVYGAELRFIAFEVKIGDCWLAVPQAEDVCARLRLEFVPYREVSTDLAALDAERDRPSEIAIRRGMGDGHTREGIVLRPLVELTKSNGARVIAKHKHPKFCETQRLRVVTDADLQALTDANEIADDYVTYNRLSNVLSHIPVDFHTVEHTGDVVRAMVADVEREATDVVMTKEIRKAVGRKAGALYQKYLVDRLREAA